MSAVLVVTVVFTKCLFESEVIFVFVCCCDIEFGSDFIVILHCSSCTALWSTFVVLMCFINIVNIEQNRDKLIKLFSSSLCNKDPEQTEKYEMRVTIILISMLLHSFAKWFHEKISIHL